MFQRVQCSNSIWARVYASEAPNCSHSFVQPVLIGSLIGFHTAPPSGTCCCACYLVTHAKEDRWQGDHLTSSSFHYSLLGSQHKELKKHPADGWHDAEGPVLSSLALFFLATHWYSVPHHGGEGTENSPDEDWQM